MRKLTLLATTAIAAAALMAATAPAAHADREFIVVSPSGGACNPCYDTGYAGDIDFKNFNTGAYAGTCQVSFDVLFQVDGSFETYNTGTGCSPGAVSPCDDSWPGQLRVPDTGPGEIDLEICLQPAYGGAPSTHHITLNAFQNPRRWVQITEDPQYPFTLVNAYFEDGNSSDNALIQLL